MSQRRVASERKRLRYCINLLDDGSVVTADGEYLGTWGADETDAIYEFTPDGEIEPLLTHPHIPFLCEKIENWHNDRLREIP
jgi:hypothetical protein